MEACEFVSIFSTTLRVCLYNGNENLQNLMESAGKINMMLSITMALIEYQKLDRDWI